MAVFPELSKEEILDLLDEIGVSLEVDELNEPHRFKDKVRSIYMALVQKAIGKEEDLSYFTSIPSQAEKKKQEWSPYCEVTNETYTILKLYMICKDFMSICGIPGSDFTLRDLFAPTHKRFKHQLSAMINFFKFRYAKTGSYDTYMIPQDELYEDLQKIIQETKDILAVHEQAQQEASIRNTEKQDVEQKCMNLQTEISKKNKLQASMRQESVTLKKHANELKDQLAFLTLEIQEMMNEERKLQSQVVSSPDVLQARLQEIQEAVQQERQDCIQCEQESTMSKMNLSKLSKAIQEGSSVCKFISTAVLEEQKKYQLVLTDIQNLEQGILQNDKTCHQLKEKTDLYQQEIHILGKYLVLYLLLDLVLFQIMVVYTLSNTHIYAYINPSSSSLYIFNFIHIEDKVHHNRKQFKMKMDSMQHSMEAANAELFLVEKDRRDGMARIEAMKQEVSALEDLIIEEEETFTSEIMDMLNQYRDFEKQVMEHDQLFLAALKNVNFCKEE